MSDLSQAASSVDTCTVFLSNSSQILAPVSGVSSPLTDMLSPLDDDQKPQNSSGDGDLHVFDAVSLATDKVLSQKEGDQSQQSSPGDGFGKLSSLKNCNPICSEGEIKQLEENEECGVEMQMKQYGNGEQEVVLHKASDENACANMQGKACEISCKEHCDDDVDGVSDAHINVDACSSQMSMLSVSAGKEGQVEFCCTNEGTQSVTARPLTATNGQNDSALSLSSVRSDEQSKATPLPRKPAAWHTAEPKARAFPEPEFVMEASSWPTLAESRHTKPSEARALTSNKETVAVSLPVEKVPSSQVHHMEATPKHVNANPSQAGSKFRPSYKKSSISGYGKPNFPAAESVPVPPMGVHVPSANVFIPDQSMKGNGLVGMNTFFPGPYQGRGHAPFYYRGEGLAPFPHNAAVMPAYGRGHPGWQPYSRGYGDAHSGFVPQYDQHFGPRHMRPPTTHFMNTTPVYYNHPNFQASDMPYMPVVPAPAPAPVPAPASAPGYNYATPYYGPSGPPGGVMQAPDYTTIQEKLQRQIEYYFSLDNLCHDIYLRSKMDDEGFVPVTLIASFPRVQSITLNSFLILEAMKKSSLVEVKNGKLRSYDWRRWKPHLSGTSQSNGIESANLFAPSKHTGPAKAKEQEYGKSEEPGEHGLESGSSAEPWTGSRSHAEHLTGNSANLGAESVPAETSIDSR